MSPLNPRPGVRVGDRYELDRRIAGGGMGEVWAARDDVLNRQVAVKLMRGEHAGDPSFVARFRTEARHAASLTHPGIASVYDFGEDDGASYLVMELVPGEPLSARLVREPKLAPTVAVSLLAQAAVAVQAAHDVGLVHRDVKPANLMITPDEQVKVTDFGIAHLGSDEPVTRTGEVMGTAQYLSPEQAMGQRANAASDIYALGVVGYEMLAGRRPFEAESPVAVAMAHVQREPEPLPADVPPALAAVIAQAMAKDPAQRPASAAGLAGSLRSSLASSDAPTVAVTGLGAAAATPVRAARPVPPLSVGPAHDDTRLLAPVAGVLVGDPDVGPEPSRRNLGGRILLGLLLVALVAVVGAVLSQQLGRDGSEPVTTPSGTVRPTTPPPTTPSASPTTNEPTSRTSTTDTPSQSPTTDDPTPSQTPTPTSETTTAPPTPTSEPTPTTEPTQTPKPSSQTPDTPQEQAIALDPGDYVGRDATEVRGELEVLGLRTKLRRVTADGAAPDTVVRLSPAGPFQPGDVVTVDVPRDGNGDTGTGTGEGSDA